MAAAAAAAAAAMAVVWLKEALADGSAEPSLDMPPPPEEGGAGGGRLGRGEVVHGEGVHARPARRAPDHPPAPRPRGAGGDRGDDDGTLLEAEPRLQLLEVLHLAGVHQGHLVHHT